MPLRSKTFSGFFFFFFWGGEGEVGGGGVWGGRGDNLLQNGFLGSFSEKNCTFGMFSPVYCFKLVTHAQVYGP